MAPTYLTTAECAILEVLYDQRWRTPTEIAETEPASGLHVQIVRSHLRYLAGNGLVERGGWGDSTRWGEFRISKAGLNRVNEARQLRLA